MHQYACLQLPQFRNSASVEGQGPCRLCSKDSVSDGHHNLINKQKHSIMIQKVTGVNVTCDPTSAPQYICFSCLVRLRRDNKRINAKRSFPSWHPPIFQPTKRSHFQSFIEDIAHTAGQCGFIN